MSWLKRAQSNELSPLPIFNHLNQLNQEIGRLFENDWTGATKALEGTPLWQMAWSPAVDVRQEGDRYLITADVPGMEAKDIKVSMTNNTIQIEGKRESEFSEEGKNYSLQERSYGSFCRSFTLPLRVEGSRITAKTRNGVLTLTVPIAESEKAKRIDVKVD